MTLSRRGRITAIVAGVVAVVLIGLGAFALFTGKNPVTEAVNVVHPTDPPPPACPLNGTPAPHGKIPHRGVVAVKVENTTDAYPQDGVDKADIVYEEVVEGGITRWVALFQCQDAKRVGPVRSVRTTDPDILLQYGKPILAYSGGANKVVKIANRSGLHLVDETSGGDAFTRDPNRVEPHNLFVDVPKIRKVEKKYAGHPPDPMFTYTPYDQLADNGKKARSVSITFSSLASVGWVWKNTDGGAWWREDGGKPNVLQDGNQIGAKNVIVQYVKAVPGPYTDVVGSPSPLVTMTGKGKAVLLRNGREIAGTWSRPSIKDVTKFTTKDGSEFQLDPGQTWVELFPAKGDFSTEASIKFSK